MIVTLALFKFKVTWNRRRLWYIVEIDGPSRRFQVLPGWVYADQPQLSIGHLPQEEGRPGCPVVSHGRVPKTDEGDVVEDGPSLLL